MLGIKGTGMSSLAIILKQFGNVVTGSDYPYSSFTEEALNENDIYVSEFSIENVRNIDLLIAGHLFMGTDNIELVQAHKLNIECMEYNEALAYLIQDYYSIAVSGSNGKTTTTGLLATILDSVENTTYLIGNSQAQGNKKSKYFVFEACEHREHFLKYHPNMILINNIDYDHIDYYKTKKDYINAFYKFADNCKGRIIVNGDDINLRSIKNAIYFGVENKSMFYAENINYDNGIDYDLFYKESILTHVHLDSYGKYMVYDSLAAITCAICLGIDIRDIVKYLQKFKGLKRRFKETIINDDVYIDDYAHHPSKIKAIIEAVRNKYPNKKIIAFYRPDRVSRLNYFAKEFYDSLNKADKMYILPYLKNTEEEKESIHSFTTQFSKVKLTDDKEYKKIAKYNGVCYLMMSSKDMSEVKENILKYKGD